jgi:hypothetical protein
MIVMITGFCICFCCVGPQPRRRPCPKVEPRAETRNSRGQTAAAVLSTKVGKTSKVLAEESCRDPDTLTSPDEQKSAMGSPAKTLA